MPRPKKKKTEPMKENTAKLVSMVLRLSQSEHAWILHISETTTIPMPKIVQLIVNDAMAKSPETYIAQIKNIQKDQHLKMLLQQRNNVDEQIKKIQNDDNK